VFKITFLSSNIFQLIRNRIIIFWSLWSSLSGTQKLCFWFYSVIGFRRLFYFFLYIERITVFIENSWLQHKSITEGWIIKQLTQIHNNKKQKCQMSGYPKCHLLWPIGRRSFAVSGPAICNGLPADLRLSTLFKATFAQRLKVHLFTITEWDMPRGARISIFWIRIRSVSATNYPYPYIFTNRYPYPICIHYDSFSCIQSTGMIEANWMCCVLLYVSEIVTPFL